MVDAGFTITRAIQSRSWPGISTNLEYAAVWGTREQVGEGVRASRTTSMPRGSRRSSNQAGRVEGRPIRLAENTGIAFQGCIVLDMGFVVDPPEAQEWIEKNPRNAEVLFPYLNGEDLNSRPDCSASRWVIDFNDRAIESARDYLQPFQRVQQLVKPERDGNKRAVRRERWWQFAERAAGLRKAIASLDDVLVMALVSKAVMPQRVPTAQVFSHRLAVFASDSDAYLAILTSSPHWLWAVTYSSTLESRVNYSPSDCFLTFPRPQPTDELDHIGRVLDEERREMMLRRELGPHQAVQPGQ